ncbi:porin [Massilia glaciei]|uniref:Porin n=1 Tax=Massilia glaciei TaxID=1524097 RepID=A0A2U2I7Q3_9BURK|nr:porin [Massilia glaciei]PWF55755.1 porin [Massilia glaciei]
MKTSSLAIAVAFGACATVAQAQSPASAYGLPASGTLADRACRDCAMAGRGVPQAPKSARGSAALGKAGGKDLSAVFTFDAGALPDSRTAEERHYLGRQAFVGVAGKFGALTVGRHHDLEQLAVTDVADPFHGGLAVGAGNLVGHEDAELDTSVRFITRERHGLSAAASLGLGEVSGNPRGNRAWGVSVGLESGAFTVRLAHQNKNVAKVQTQTGLGNVMDAKNTILAANYDVGVGKVYAAYSANRGWGSSPLWNPDNPYGASMATTASTDSRDVLVGLAVPFGATTVLASFIRKNDRNLANQDANQAAIGLSYASSRRTDYYAAWSRITNRNGAGYRLAGAAAAPASSALNVGMRHSF